MMAPVCPDRLAKRRAGEIMVIKSNVDKYPELAARLSIQAVPTLIVFHRGTERAGSCRG